MIEKQTVIDMPVTTATIMEDRALVARTFEVEVAAGLTELVSTAVSPLLVESTLTARVLSGTATVKSISFSLSHHLEAKEPLESRRLAANRRDLQEKLQAGKAQLQLITRQKEECARLLELWQEQVAWQAVQGTGGLDSWLADYHQIAAAGRQYQNEKLGQEEKYRQLTGELDKIELQFQAANTPVHHYDGCLRLLIMAPQGGKIKLTVEGILPCVAWRPGYQAALAENQVTLERQAAVWQLSGEDWQNVLVQFSTARPGKGAEFPTLEPDVLHLREKSGEERQIIRVVSQDVADDSLSSTAQNEVLPGVADGGQVQCFAMPEAVNIPSRASSRFFSLDKLTFPAQISLEARPEMGAYAALVSRQILTDSRPLLAGPVLLKRGNCFVGRTLLEFVAPGHTFELPFGSDDEVTVNRWAPEVEEVPKGGATRYLYNVEVFIRNLSKQVKDLQVTERVPVSESAEVTVTLGEPVTPGYTLAENGFVTWAVTLPPKSEKKLQLNFEVLASKKVQWRR